MTTKRKTFSKEFKQEAVRLLERGDRHPADITRELGVKRNQLYKWQEQINANGEAAFPGRGRRSDKEARLAQLERENERLKEENEILKKGRTVLCQGVRVKYQFIEQQQQQHSITRLCDALGVSRCG